MFKKFFILGIVLGIFLFLVVRVSLGQDEILSDPGLTPDSPFYFLEIIAEKIGNLFTFGDKAKAERMLTLMEERMAETHKMLEEGKIEYAQKAFTRYQAHFQECEKRLEKMEKEGKSIDDVSKKVATVTEKHIAVLERVYEKVPDQAKDAILHAMEVSLTGQERALSALGRKNPETALRVQLRIMDQRVERIKKHTQDKNLLAEKQALKNYKRGEKEIKVLLERAKKKGVNVEGLETLVLEKTARHIETLWKVYEKAPESAKEGLLRAIENSMKGHQKIKEVLKNKVEKIKEKTTISEKVREEIKKEIQKKESEKKIFPSPKLKPEISPIPH